MRALGDIGEGARVQALTEQLNLLREGRGRVVGARCAGAHRASVERAAVQGAADDKDPSMRRAARRAGRGRRHAADRGRRSQPGGATTDAEPVRAAMAFALQKLGRNYVARLVDFLDRRRSSRRRCRATLELGPPVEQDVLPRLQEPDEAIREHVARCSAPSAARRRRARRSRPHRTTRPRRSPGRDAARSSGSR